MDSRYDTFRRKLRFHRQQAGMTQQDLAKAMGLSIATISELERGEKVRVPTYDKVLRFEQILKDADGELLEAAGYVNNEDSLGSPGDPTDSVAMRAFQDEFRMFWKKGRAALEHLEEDNERLRAEVERLRELVDGE